MPGTAKPLLCLNITYPTAAYDVNVEAAKDSVLFADEAAVLHFCELFFSSCFTSAQQERQETSAVSEAGGSDLLLDDGSTSTEHLRSDLLGVDVRQLPRPAIHYANQHAREVGSGRENRSATSATGATNSNIPPIKDGPWAGFNISTHISPHHEAYDLEGDNGALSSGENTHENAPGSASLNPWTIAKRKAAVAAKKRSPNQGRERAAAPNYQQLPTPQAESRVSFPPAFFSSSPIQARDAEFQNPRQYLPSPDHSSPSFRGTRSSKRPRLQRPENSSARPQRPPAALPYSAVNTVVPAGAAYGDAQEAQAPPLNSRITQFMVPVNSSSKQAEADPHRQADLSSQADDSQSLISAYSSAILQNPEVDPPDALPDFEDEGNAELPGLVLPCSHDLAAIGNMRDALQAYDTYIGNGQTTFGFARPDLTLWEERLSSLLSFEGQADSINLKVALSDHLAAFE